MPVDREQKSLRPNRPSRPTTDRPTDRPAAPRRPLGLTGVVDLCPTLPLPTDLHPDIYYSQYYRAQLYCVSRKVSNATGSLSRLWQEGLRASLVVLFLLFFRFGRSVSFAVPAAVTPDAISRNGRLLSSHDSNLAFVSRKSRGEPRVAFERRRAASNFGVRAVFRVPSGRPSSPGSRRFYRKFHAIENESLPRREPGSARNGPFLEEALVYR